MSMNWEQLLQPVRLGKDPEPVSMNKSPFEIDGDRIKFSSAFRRMQDKMQVHGISGNDNTRTRLTHSIEVSAVARTLGLKVGETIYDEISKANIQPTELGHIISAAALAHDIGNCSFGHLGEDTIKHFFNEEEYGWNFIKNLSDDVIKDFQNFDGNGQGFRVITRLQGFNNDGGLCLTYPVLASVQKYPSIANAYKPQGVTGKKAGIFLTEVNFYEEIAKTLGLRQYKEGELSWARHPLAWLLEASDDICYRIVDIEDGYNMNQLSFDEVEELLLPLINEKKMDSFYKKIESKNRKVAYLRAKVIDTLIDQVTESFFNNYEKIMNGTHTKSLLDLTPSINSLKVISKVTRERIFNTEDKQKLHMSGYQYIYKILRVYSDAFLSRELGKSHPKHEAIIRIFPESSLVPNDRESWLRAIIDYVSGMTDSFTVEHSRIFD